MELQWPAISALGNTAIRAYMKLVTIAALNTLTAMLEDYPLNFQAASTRAAHTVILFHQQFLRGTGLRL